MHLYTEKLTCGSNHITVICKLRVNPQTLKGAKVTTRLQYDRLLNERYVKDTYIGSVKSKYNREKSKWKLLKESLVREEAEFITKKN